jgi:hypothetical protein
MQRDTLTEPQPAPLDVQLAFRDRIYHETQTVDDWIGGRKIDEPIGKPAIDIVHSEKVQQCTDQVLDAIDQSYQNIILSHEADTYSTDDIADAAVEYCLQQAILAKIAGDDKETSRKLETLMLVSSMAPNPPLLFDTMMKIAENGLADNMLEAKEALKDFHVRDLSSSSLLDPVIGRFGPYDDLLKLASTNPHTTQTSSGDQRSRQEMSAALMPDECIALAKHQANNLHNTDLAAHTAIQALTKLEKTSYYSSDSGYGRMSDVLTAAHDIIARADSQSSEDDRTEQLNHIMSKIAKHRAPNLQPYRVNDPLCSELDFAIVELVAAGRQDIASKLISGARGEEIVIQNTLHGVADAIGREQAVSSETLISEITTLHYNKKAALEAGLASLDIRPDLAIKITDEMPYPEAALDIGKERWQVAQRFDTRIVSSHVIDNNNPARAIDILSYIDPSLDSAESLYVAEHIIDYRSRIGLDTGDIAVFHMQKRVSELCQLIIKIKEINQQRAEFADDIPYAYASERLKQRYIEPLATLEALAKRFPNASYKEFIEYAVEPFADGCERLTPEQQQRYDAIHDKFEGICERSDIIRITSIEDIKALENLDPENLRTALSRVYSGPNDLSGRIQVTKDQSVLLQIQRTVVTALRNSNFSNPEDYNTYLTEFRNVPDDVFEAWLAYAKHDDLYGDLIRQLFNVDKLSGEDHLHRLHNLRDTLNGGVMDFLQTPGAMENDKKIQLARILLQSSDGPNLAPLLKTGQDLLGTFLTTDSLRLLGDIMHADTVPEELLSLGVTKPGEAGINQLKNLLDKFTQSIFQTGEIPAGPLVRHPFLANYVKAMVRYEISQFGSHGSEEFLALLTTSERGNYQVGTEYHIGQANIAAKDQEALAEFTITEDAVNEFHAYARSLRAAQDIVPATGAIEWVKLGEILNAIQQDITSRGLSIHGGIEKLQAKIDQFIAAGKDTTKLETQLEQQRKAFDKLSDIDFQNVEDFDITALCQTIQTLSTHNSIVKQGNLQTLLIATALLKNRFDEQVPPPKLPDTETPTLEQISDMADLIGHLTNQELWGPLFSQIGGEKELQNLLSIDALTATIERSKTIATKGQQTIRFLPTRGALMELSGHIADACWASKHESLAGLHPNTTAVIFIQNPSTPARRMAGATFLIETTSADGEPLLVIRGLNPLQNIITGLDQKSFVVEFTAYARDIAEDQGRRLAIVIDDHCGGSSTNRPTLFAYLSELKTELTPVRLASNIDTTINGYNIVNDTYLI